MKKVYAIKPGDFKDLATGHGYCIASDAITVEGEQVGYMYKEKPDEEDDSGWRFFSGYETDEYLENPDNCGLHDVNSIANFDKDIIPFLDSPYNSAFERSDSCMVFIQVPFDPPESD